MHRVLGKAHWLEVGLILVAAPACGAASDLVAAAYGDYDPNQPPKVMALAGPLAFHDPTLFRSGERYWVYGSGQGLEAKSSANLQTWQNEARVFDQNPNWIADLLPDVTALWSPSVAYFGSMYHLYYSASVFGANQSCIGHATAAFVDAGSVFEDHGSIICSNVSGQTDDFNAIDPSVFVESEQTPWLAFGSYNSGIKLIPLDATGARLGSELVSLARRGSDNPAIQEPFVYEWRGWYYLFVSFDQCCQGVNSTHNIRVGRSHNLGGPYIDKAGVNMMNGGGTLVLGGDDHWPGPGSNVIFNDGARHFNVYHAYDADNNGVNTLRIAEITFDNDGWPVSAGP